MPEMMYKSDANYVSCRSGVYYYTRRVPCDVKRCDKPTHTTLLSLDTKVRLWLGRIAKVLHFAF